MSMNPFRLAAFADEASESLQGQIEALTAHQIPTLEIRHVDGINVSELALEKAQDVQAALEAAGIKVWSIGSPIGKIDMADDFRPHLDTFRHTLEIADIFGARCMRIFSFYHRDIPYSNTLRDSVLERLEMLSHVAAESGITLCHENEKGIYGDIAIRCVEIHKAIPAIRAVFDPANFAQCGQDTLSAWDSLEAYITYMHIKDVDAEETIVPAGHGICRIPELLARYHRMGGEVLTLEPHLCVFSGLSALEQEGVETHIAYRYSSAAEAFSAGVQALRACMAHLN